MLLSRLPLVHHPLTRSLVLLTAPSFAACTFGWKPPRLRQRPHIHRHGKIIQPWLSLLRLVSVLYFTWAGSQSPGRGTRHAQYTRTWCVDLSLQSRASNPTGVSSPPGAHNEAAQCEDPSEGPSFVRSSTRPSLCPPPSVVFLACIAAVSRYSQISTAALYRNRWFVYIDHHRSLMSPPPTFPNRPIFVTFSKRRIASFFHLDPQHPTRAKI